VKANTIFILGGMVLCYYLSSYSFEMSFLKRIFFAFMAGVFHHLSMVHLWHDASHSSYTRNSSVWKYFGILGESLTGHSMYIWIHRHVFAHHIWTNVAGVDPDIAIYKCSPKKPIEHYRVNQFVMPSALQPIIYPFVTFQMKIDDVISFHRGQMENVVINDTGILQTIRFYFGKFVYYFHRVFLPIYLGHSIFKIMLLQTITEATSGVFFGILSQISHVSENCEWPSEKPIPKDWGECQVLTTTDYEHESPFWTYLSGFLNYQVPHHLFPSVAPHFYPEICK
jgi:fatty acid desaturase